MFHSRSFLRSLHSYPPTLYTLSASTRALYPIITSQVFPSFTLEQVQCNSLQICKLTLSMIVTRKTSKF